MRRKVLRSKDRVTRTSRKDHLEKNGNAEVVEKRDTACLTVEILPRIVKERSFSKKKLAVLTEPQFGGKELALVDDKVWFPYILDSGTFTTVVPKLLLKKVKDAESELIEATLEKYVEMKTAVKDVVTIAKSMIHITVQLTTSAGRVGIRSLRALAAQDEMEDMLIGEDLLKCLGIDPHEILAARLEEGTLEAGIDGKKMADKSPQRQKWSMIGMPEKGPMLEKR